MGRSTPRRTRWVLYCACAYDGRYIRLDPRAHALSPKKNDRGRGLRYRDGTLILLGSGSNSATTADARVVSRRSTSSTSSIHAAATTAGHQAEEGGRRGPGGLLGLGLDGGTGGGRDKGQPASGAAAPAGEEDDIDVLLALGNAPTMAGDKDKEGRRVREMCVMTCSGRQRSQRGRGSTSAKKRSSLDCAYLLDQINKGEMVKVERGRLGIRPSRIGPSNLGGKRPQTQRCAACYPIQQGWAKRSSTGINQCFQKRQSTRLVSSTSLPPNSEGETRRRGSRPN